ncbi:hypothetical protein GCM10027020_35690 [Nocardioides salsibiostraticola]
MRRRPQVYDVLCRPAVMVTVIVATVAVALMLVFVVGVANSRTQMPPPGLADEAAPRVQRLLSYTPTTVEDDLRIEQAYLTSDYRAEYADLVSGQLAPQAERDGLSVQAEVTETAVVDATSETMVVLMIAEVSSTKDGLRGGASTGRFRVTLRLEGGSWLIAGLDVV